MPWREFTRLSERSEFVAFARRPGANMSELCRRYKISRQTGYKWLKRTGSGEGDVEDRSRRPLSSPQRTAVGIESQVLAVREQYPFYGGRKIRRRLLGDGVERPPAASTITAILKRNGLLAPERRLKRDWQRFEEDEANGLWQMDFKGHIPLSRGRCHPLTVLDDHSRFCICLAACANEQGSTVRSQLTGAFQLYGLPERMLMDNGAPWGSSGRSQHTRFTAWLIRLGVTVSHGRPHHPQTQGKEERFHRTLKLEVIGRRAVWHDNPEIQAAFDGWRPEYNFERPHESLGLEPPASRYRPSCRAFPSELPLIEYDADFEVRRVRENGRIKLKGRYFFLGKAFAKEPVGLRQVGEGVWDVYYCHQRLVRIDLTQRQHGSDEV
jgi:transposase InsO family protein